MSVIMPEQVEYTIQEAHQLSNFAKTLIAILTFKIIVLGLFIFNMLNRLNNLEISIKNIDKYVNDKLVLNTKKIHILNESKNDELRTLNIRLNNLFETLKEQIAINNNLIYSDIELINQSIRDNDFISIRRYFNDDEYSFKIRWMLRDKCFSNETDFYNKITDSHRQYVNNPHFHSLATGILPSDEQMQLFKKTPMPSKEQVKRFKELYLGEQFEQLVNQNFPYFFYATLRNDGNFYRTDRFIKLIESDDNLSDYRNLINHINPYKNKK